MIDALTELAEEETKQVVQVEKLKGLGEKQLQDAQDKKRQEWFEYLQKSKEIAGDVLREMEISSTDRRIEIISKLLTSKQNTIEKARGVKQKGIDGLLADFTAPSIHRGRFQTKIPMADCTIVRDETDTETIVHYHTTGLKAERVRGAWVAEWSPIQSVDEKFLLDKGIKRTEGKKMRIVLHLQHTSEFSEQVIPFKELIHKVNLDRAQADFSIQLEEIPFTVDEIEKLNKEVKKRRIDLDNPENNRRVAVDRIEFRRSLLEKSRTESSKSRTGYVVEKNIDRIVDHVFKNIEVYGVENIDLIGGYIFEALVELELSDTDSKLSQDLIGVLSARPENRNVDFKLSSEEVKRVEELYTVYSKENGNSHADKLCIGNNISIRKIAGLIEIKKASSSDISEEYVSQVLKSAKNLNSFISWINSNPTLKSGEKILIGKFEQAAWNNMAIFIVEPHQEGDRGNRSFRRQEFNIHLLRSIIDSKVIHEIATAVVGDLKKSPGQA